MVQNQNNYMCSAFPKMCCPDWRGFQQKRGSRKHWIKRWHLPSLDDLGILHYPITSYDLADFHETLAKSVPPNIKKKKKKFLHLINYLRKTIGIYYNYFQSKWLKLLKALAPRRINFPPTQLFQCTFITSKYRQWRQKLLEARKRRPWF